MLLRLMKIPSQYQLFRPLGQSTVMWRHLVANAATESGTTSWPNLRQMHVVSDNFSLSFSLVNEFNITFTFIKKNQGLLTRLKQRHRRNVTSHHFFHKPSLLSQTITFFSQAITSFTSYNLFHFFGFYQKITLSLENFH